MRSSENKSTLITFTLKKTIRTEPLTIDGTDIAEHENAKLLGVTFDQHLRFSAQVEMTITKSKPAFHALVQLKKSGIAPPSLFLFSHMLLPAGIPTPPVMTGRNWKNINVYACVSSYPTQLAMKTDWLR